MKTTKLIKKTIWYVCLCLFQGTHLWAIEPPVQADDIDMLMWLFFGFCALIIIGPLIAALFLIFGSSKRSKREKVGPMASFRETFEAVLARYLS